MIYELQIGYFYAVTTVIPKLGDLIFIRRGIGKFALLLGYNIEAEIGFISKLIAYHEFPFTVL